MLGLYYRACISSGRIGVQAFMLSTPYKLSRFPPMCASNYKINDGAVAICSSENDIVFLAIREQVGWPSILITAILFACPCLLFGLHLSVLCGSISLLLVCNLLQAIELFSVQLIQLGVDICLAELAWRTCLWIGLGNLVHLMVFSVRGIITCSLNSISILSQYQTAQGQGHSHGVHC